MSQSQTSGYDVLVQLSEQELNSQLANFALDPVITSLFRVTLTFLSIELDKDTTPPLPPMPEIDNCVRINVRADAFLIANNQFFYGGTIEITAPLDVITSDGNQFFPDIPAGTRVLVLQLAPAANAAYPIVKPQSIPNNIKAEIQSQLRQRGPIPLGLTISPSGGSDPLTPTDMHVKVIDNPNATGIDCVTLMLNTGGSTGGNPGGVFMYLGNSPTGAVVTLSNQLVIERLIRPNLASALGATFDPPCVLHEPVAISTGHWYISYINLATMFVTVEGDYIRVAGTFERSKKAWSLSGYFSIRLYIVLNNGVLDIVQVTDTLDVDYRFKAWVWVAAGLTCGALGLIVTAVVQFAINKAIDTLLAKFSDIASKLGLNGIAVPAIPVGLNGGQLQLQSVALDDLTISGPVRLVPSAPAGIAMLGDLSICHTDTVTLANGVLVTGSHLIQQPGTHYVITRSRSFRGLFSAHLSQAAYPVTYAWTLDGVAISGAGTVSVSEPHGWMLELIDLSFQTEVAHCWIATPVGVTLTGRILTVKATDAAGHVSTASKPLSCVGVTVRDFVAEPMALSANVAVLAIVGDDDSGTTLDGVSGTFVPVSTAIDRKSELAAAFKAGLAVKPDKKTPPIVSQPPAKK